jgi:hypothetical protein
MRLFLHLVLTCILGTGIHAQVVNEHVSNTTLQEFLDELANERVIRIVSVTKPYSRSYIATLLGEADASREKLNRRQQKQLDIYLASFAQERWEIPGGKANLIRYKDRFRLGFLPPEATYQDSFFRFTLYPLGGVVNYSNEQGKALHTWGGAGFRAYMGNHWSAWASLRDNRLDGELFNRPTYLSRAQAGNYKGLTGGGRGGEYSETRGGIAYAWRWGAISLEKDHLEWGDNYHGASIFSGRVPSYAMIKLHLHPTKWLDFKYHHGWLISQVIDSSRSYFPSPGAPYKYVYREKYIAANLFTVTPVKGLAFSFGNSVIYSDGPVYPGFLVPFLFYKSAVHTQTAGYIQHNHNSAFFLNLSARLIPHLHLYGTWFVDEFSVTRVSDPNRTNFTGTKGGVRLSNWPIPNLSLTTEYTFTFPKTYQHRTPVTTYETNRYNMGHYLRDNAREIYLAAQFKPVAGLLIELSYQKAEKGNLYTYTYGTGTVDTDPYMQDISWRDQTTSAKISYQLFNHVRIFAESHFMHIQGYDLDSRTAQYYLDLYTPPLFHGKNQTLVLGFVVNGE